MKQCILSAALFFCLFFSACTPIPAEKYFGVAVLSSNFLVGFANSGQLRELESPTVKMSEKNGQPEAMQRKEVIGSKIEYVEKNLQNLKELKETADTKDILQASLALHEYVLPIYKNEYGELAKLYDEGASKERIQQQAQLIEEKYFAHYDQLFNRLIAVGKLYAEKHAIKVNWGT